MLQYLVTSKVRRRLLELLWVEHERGSVAELAELAGVAFAGAHAELKEMHRLQLAVSEMEGGKEVFSANARHPAARMLRELFEVGRVMPESTDDDETVKRQLAFLGAPLRGVQAVEVTESEQLSVLVRGASLARRDPVVARSLPLCFWKLRDRLDVKVLAELAPRSEDKHAVGFFMELAGELGGDRRLGGLAEHLRDRRMTLQRDFFVSPGHRQVFRDFPLAAKWNFRMNTDLESFRAVFTKFR